MLEWLTAAVGTELAKKVWETGLELGKDAAKDYVKDFFKSSLSEGVAALNVATLQKSSGQAVGEFLKLFVEELEFLDVHPTSIDHFYGRSLKQFAKDKKVRGVLGEPFATDCKRLKADALQSYWQPYQPQGTPFPEDFDWQRIAKEYVRKVKAIVKADADLSRLLQLELAERNAAFLERMAGLPKGFDLEQYRANLDKNYGGLKLHAIDCTDNQYRMKLWRMFIEQTAREGLPPSRYDLPWDVKRRYLADGRLEADLSEAQLERYRRDYFQQPSQKILKALNLTPQPPSLRGKGGQEICSPLRVGEGSRSVVLGDPGAGKSTLLQYLALRWVEGNAAELPLLIELREYVSDRAKVTSFLEFLNKGCGADWQFDEVELDRYLRENPTLVMFDGLDEVFEPTAYTEVAGEIVRFAQQYPLAQVVVTSRIIGYNPDRLQHAGFRHWTLQPLEWEEITEFIQRWYDLALGDDDDKPRLVQHLKDAISRSKSIQNLADNPLLLTMMAILNRRQPLPRDRAELYDRCTRVLLHNWDIDHKRLQLPFDAIGRQEKQAMLRRLAYEMQASEKGLAGNLIEDERLKQILTGYMREQGFSEPPEKAGKLIEQLRERNFIICYGGGDTYSFLHRTFLEYFYATEIVNRFNKRGTDGGITFEVLRDEIFRQHWQEETWHEVLPLICGSIDPKFAGELIEFLMGVEVDRTQFLSEEEEDKGKLKPEGLMNLLLAADCFSEVENQTELESLGNSLLVALQREVEHQDIELNWDAADELLYRISQNFSDTLEWLKERVLLNPYREVRGAIPRAIAFNYKDQPDTLEWLKEQVLLNPYEEVKKWSVIAIAYEYKDQLATLEWLKERVLNDFHQEVRRAAVHAIAFHYKEQPDTLDWLKERVLNDVHENVRQAAVRAIASNYKEQPDTLEWLKEQVLLSPSEEVKQWSVLAIAEHYKEQPDTLDWLKERVLDDQHKDVQWAAVWAIAEEYKEQPDTLDWLKERGLNDVHEDVRRAAVWGIAREYKEQPDTLDWLKERVLHDQHKDVRQAAVWAIAYEYKAQPDTLDWLKERGLNDVHQDVRQAAVWAIAEHYKEQPDTFDWLKERGLNDVHQDVRQAAVWAIAEHYKEQPDTFDWLKERVLNDVHQDVRRAAVIAIVDNYKEQPDTFDWLKKRGQYDDNPDVRQAVMEAVINHYQDYPNTLELLKELVINDASFWVRNTVLKAVIKYYTDHPNTFDWLKQLALDDPSEDVRQQAVRAIASEYKEQPETLDWLKERGQHDAHEDVRQAAVEAIVSNYEEQRETLDWLKERGQHDAHENVRRAAVEAIVSNYEEQPETLDWLKQRVLNDPSENVQWAAVRAIAEHYKEQPDTLDWLKQRVLNDQHKDVRQAAVWAIASEYKEQPETLDWLKERGQHDAHEDVRQAAVRAIVSYYKEQPDILDWLKERGQHDAHEDVRQQAVRAIVSYYKEQPDILDWLKERGQHDAHEDVRQQAVRAIYNYEEQPETLDWLKERGLNDPSENVRRAAVWAIAANYKEQPDILDWLKQRVLNDPSENVRRAAVWAIAVYYKEQPETLDWLKQRVLNDPREDVRRAAVWAIAFEYKHRPDSLPWIEELAKTDRGVKQTVIAEIVYLLQYLEDCTNELIFLLQCIVTDSEIRTQELEYKSPEEILEFLLETNPEEAELILRKVAQNYPDEALRRWAEGRLSNK